MKTKRIDIIVPFLFAMILAVSLRGMLGSPTVEELNGDQWRKDGPFELSPERGRFALTYSLIEDGSFAYSIPLARFALPDLGYQDGRYVSLFAPGVSFLLIPAYEVGKVLSATQAATYAMIGAFALINALLVRTIALHLGAHLYAAWLAALAFLFATPAYAYAVSLYQHHVSVLVLLLSLYVFLRWHVFWSPLLIWFLVAASISIDYPNIFLMFPIALATLARLFSVEKTGDRLAIKFDVKALLSMAIVVVPLLFFFWTNSSSYGHPLTLSGSVQNVREINEEGNPRLPLDRATQPVTTGQPAAGRRSLLGFFQTRNLARGLVVHTVSLERGVIIFAPIVLFGLLGIPPLSKRRSRMTAVIVATIAVNLILYSLWGDPWGGWAFGSRYLIPAYAMLAILLAIALTKKQKSWLFMMAFMLVLLYSIAVNTLGALTTNRLPPKEEAQMLEATYGQHQPYTYVRNWKYLNEAGTQSLFYRELIRGVVDPRTFYLVVVSVTGSVAAVLVLNLLRDADSHQRRSDE